MMERTWIVGGGQVVLCAPEGPLVGMDGDVNELVSLAWSTEADVLVLPVSRFDPRFFDLRSGLAGEVAQKCANYRLHLVVLGDVSVWLEQSRAFRHFVHEANRGRSLWFVPDEEVLQERLC